MSRIKPLAFAALDSTQQQVMKTAEREMGFLANDGLIMAHKPMLMQAVLQLVQAVYAPGRVDIELKKLVALMTSSAAGCQYCTGHTSLAAMSAGVAADKVADIWNFQRSERYTEAERAALDVARNAAFAPNAVSDEDFARLRTFFNEEQQVEIVAVIALFGFLNRWNSTLSTDLEAKPAAALQTLQNKRPRTS